MLCTLLNKSSINFLCRRTKRQLSLRAQGADPEGCLRHLPSVDHLNTKPPPAPSGVAGWSARWPGALRPVPWNQHPPGRQRPCIDERTGLVVKDRHNLGRRTSTGDLCPCREPGARPGVPHRELPRPRPGRAVTGPCRELLGEVAFVQVGRTRAPCPGCPAPADRAAAMHPWLATRMPHLTPPVLCLWARRGARPCRYAPVPLRPHAGEPAGCGGRLGSADGEPTELAFSDP
jgi:hypothetical protein